MFCPQFWFVSSCLNHWRQFINSLARLTWVMILKMLNMSGYGWVGASISSGFRDNLPFFSPLLASSLCMVPLRCTNCRTRFGGVLWRSYIGDPCLPTFYCSTIFQNLHCSSILDFVQNLKTPKHDDLDIWIIIKSMTCIVYSFLNTTLDYHKKDSTPYFGINLDYVDKALPTMCLSIG